MTDPKYRPNNYREIKGIKYPYYRDLSLLFPSQNKPLCTECGAWVSLNDCCLHKHVCEECRRSLV